MSINSMRKGMQGWFRYVVYLLAIVFAAGIIAMALGGGFSRSRDEAGGSAVKDVAVVGKEKISRDVFNRAVDNQINQYEAMGRALDIFDRIQISNSVLDNLINQRIMVQAAKADGVRVSKRDINSKVDEIIKEQVDSIRESVLSKSKEPKTDEALNKALAKRQKGLTLAKIKDDIKKSIDVNAVRDQLMIEGIQKNIENKMDKSDKALAASYDELKIAQITVDNTKLKDDEALAKANDLVKKIRDGGDFAEIASESSDDLYAASGGNRGSFMPKYYLQKELADAASTLKKGEISDPVKTDNGYVIVKLLDMKTNLPEDFNDSKKKKEYLDNYVERETNIQFNNFFENAKKNAKVEILDPEMKAHKEAMDIYNTSDPNEIKLNALKAIKGYESALSKVNGETTATGNIYAQMAILYDMLANSAIGVTDEKKKEAADYKAKAKEMVVNALNYTESNQLRLMLAKIYIDDKKYDEAAESLQIVSDNAYNAPPEIHAQILAFAEQAKDTNKFDEVIAAEKKWMEDNKDRFNTQQPGIRVSP